MHLHRLKINSFRNLRDFEITFAANADVDGTSRRLRSHAVIGQNGSGKSNMLEAIVTIFRDLDLYYTSSFDYELDYEVRGHQIQIVGKTGDHPAATIDGRASDAWELCDFRENPESGELERGHAREYLPSHIFAYYSGKSERFEGLFVDHLKQYMQFLNDSGIREDYVPPIDPNNDLLESAPVFGDADLRRLFYCKHPHSKFVLLAILLASEAPLKEVLELLGIELVDAVLFVLRKPHRLSGEMIEDDVRMGDRRFWYDRTRFSEEFLDKLWELATAPIDDTEERQVDFRGRTVDQNLLYLYLKDEEKLAALRDHIGDSYRMFRFAEGSYVADLLDDVRIFVKRKDVNDILTFDQLSEGELQLLTVLGLIRITNQDECLFLLDEPDTHLNPMWKLRYFDQINMALKQDEDAIIQGDSQIIITTHDPMMIGSLRREQVRVISQQSGKSVVECPDEHPQGMGVAGLLKSQYFGLRSTVDSETRRRLDRRNFLFSIGNQRTVAENNELTRLSDELADLGFASDFRDPYLELFVKRMAVHTQFHKETLTPKELKDQNAIADKIIDEILAEDVAE